MALMRHPAIPSLQTKFEIIELQSINFEKVKENKLLLLFKKKELLIITMVSAASISEFFPSLKENVELLIKETSL